MTNDPMERLLALRLHQQDGRRSPHKPLLALVALGRLLSTGSSRLPWSLAEEQLADLLTEFGRPSSAPRPQSAAYPFTRLRSDGVWELDADVPMDAVTPLRDQDVTGSFALGLVLILVLERFPPTRYVRPFFATGFLGAYTTYLVQQAMPQHLEYSMLVAIPAAFIVAGAFGIAIERGVIRFLYGRPLETLLATFGISLVLQQLVRTTISAQNVTVANPSWMSGSWQINPALALTYNRLYIVLFTLLVFAALLLLLKKTALGLHVRAVAQNRPMARAMGIRSDWVDALTFGLGSGIAGVAGVALSQLTNVGPNMGQAYIIDSFMVVVFGGVGNLWGTLVGAFSLGVANKFLEPYSGAVLAKILVLVFIILFIQKRPRGLFPQKGRAAEG